MQSESIQLIKQAAYYIKKAEFEKQSGFGTTLKRFYRWIRGDKPFKNVPNYEAKVPKNSYLDLAHRRQAKAMLRSGVKPGEIDQHLQAVYAPSYDIPRNFSDEWALTESPIPLRDGGIYYFSRYSPVLDGIVGQRDINLALKNKMRPKDRKAFAREYFQSKVNTPDEVADFHSLVNGPSIMDKNYKRLERNSRWADMLQYLAQNSKKVLGDPIMDDNGKVVGNMLEVNPTTNRYFRSLNVERAEPWEQSSYLSPLYYTMGIKGYADPGTVGHELGHAMYDTRVYMPEGMRDPITLSKYADPKSSWAKKLWPWRMRTIKDNPVAQKYPITEGHLDVASTILEEIGANHEFNKLMRGALKDNPALYNRFKLYTYNANMPLLATYADVYEPQLEALIARLPDKVPQTRFGRYGVKYNMQDVANKYMQDFRNYRDKVMTHYANRGEEKDLADFAPAMKAKAIRQDPTLTSDIYDYLVQQGMPIPENAWYANVRKSKSSRPIDTIISYSPPYLEQPEIDNMTKWYRQPKPAVIPKPNSTPPVPPVQR